MGKLYKKKTKKLVILVFVSFTFFLTQTTFAAMQDDFVITIKSDNEGVTLDTKFLIPTIGSGYNYNVDCDNDGTDEATAQTGDYECTYTVPGIYTIRIKDNSGEGTGFPRIYFAFEGDRFKITSLDQWGTGIWTSMEAAFHGALNMEVPAIDVPDLSAVTSMAGMFLVARSANPDVSNWDVSTVTDMSSLFNSATSANPDVSNWDVSKVTSMNRMFLAINSNPDVSSWDVSSVTDMTGMFAFTQLADPDVSTWDVSSVTSMDAMFTFAESANPDVSDWDVSKVTNMHFMFNATIVANPDVSSWDVSSVTVMDVMFSGAQAANPDVSNWDVSEVTNMEYMFAGTVLADPDVSSWDVSSVTNMEAMFLGAFVAKPDVSSWDVSAVTNMTIMFSEAVVANPDVSSWDVSAVEDMNFLFLNAKSVRPDVSDWDVSGAREMIRMFSGAILAQPDIRSWDVSGVLEMGFMLEGITLPTEMYDEILVNFNNQELQPEIFFHGGNSTFCSSEAQAARENMITSDDWTITDGGYAGEDCGSIFEINPGLTGTWYYPETSGQGLMVDVMQPLENEAGRIFVAWFTYDLVSQENNAEFGSINHRWFSASGTYVDDKANLIISLTENGRFDDPQTVTSVAVGQMKIEFTTCTTGFVSYSFDQTDVSGTFPITRLSPDQFCEDNAEVKSELTVKSSTNNQPYGGLSGTWYNPQTSGQGLMFDVMEEREQVFVAWFNYSIDGSSSNVDFGSDAHRWFSAIGDWSGNGSEMAISLSEGGVFDTPSVVTNKTVGTLKVIFDSCTKGSVEYQFPDLSISGNFPIQRLTPNVFCQDE